MSGLGYGVDGYFRVGLRGRLEFCLLGRKCVIGNLEIRLENGTTDIQPDKIARNVPPQQRTPPQNLTR
jgi:hypothetical protein